MYGENPRNNWLIGLIVAIVILCSCCIVLSAVAMPLTYNLFKLQLF